MGPDEEDAMVGRMEDDAYSQSHEARMERLHEEQMRMRLVGPAIEQVPDAPRGTSGDWRLWEVELTDLDHNALLDQWK